MVDRSGLPYRSAISLADFNLASDSNRRGRIESEGLHLSEFDSGRLDLHGARNDLVSDSRGRTSE